MSGICKTNDDGISIGDLVAIDRATNTAYRTTLKDKNNVVGVCADIYPDTGEVLICNNGLIDVNITGIMCLGDHITVSDLPGKAQAVKYDVQEEHQFGVRSIGKVIGLSEDVYSKAKVVLNIK